MTDGALRHAVMCGTWKVVRRGVYCTARIWQATSGDTVARHALEVRAAWMCLDRRGWASGYSAAALLGLPVPFGEPRTVTITLPQRRHGRRSYPGLRLRSAQIWPGDVRAIDGLPVTGAARTVADTAREHGLASGLILADAALARGLTGRADLEVQADHVSGWPGSRAVLQVAANASDRRESPAESVSFAVFVAAGLELPECNPWVIGRGAGGIRADFRWLRYRLIGEVDGRIKYLDPYGPVDAVLVEEKERQSRIEEAGFVVVRWTGAEALHQPQVMLARILRASRRAAEVYGAPVLRLGTSGDALGTVNRR